MSTETEKALELRASLRRYYDTSREMHPGNLYDRGIREGLLTAIYDLTSMFELPEEE